MSAPPKLKYQGVIYVRADADAMRTFLEKSKKYLQELFEEWVREPTNYQGLKRLFSDSDTAWVEDRLKDKFLVDLGGLGEDVIDFKALAKELAGKGE